MNDQESTEPKMSKAELLERIDASYAALAKTLQRLSDDQLSRPAPSGWAIKDHLAHLAAWELGIAALLQHHPRYAAMQVEEAMEQDKSTDELNDLIYQQNAGLSPAEAREKFEAAHGQMLQVLESLSDDDLFRPYADYLPEGGQGFRDPVLNWIVGNTYEHFDEHKAYIRDHVLSDSEARGQVSEPGSDHSKAA